MQLYKVSLHIFGDVPPALVKQLIADNPPMSQQIENEICLVICSAPLHLSITGSVH